MEQKISQKLKFPKEKKAIDHFYFPNFETRIFTLSKLSNSCNSKLRKLVNFLILKFPKIVNYRITKIPNLKK